MGVSIEIQGLTKTYGAVTALNNVSLTIEPGEFLILLGPSGCGKTTLLRCIAGLETPDDGQIIIGDQLVFSASRGIAMPAGKRRIGMVFQSYALWPHMSVSDNIGFGLQLLKFPRKEVHERVASVLKGLDMEGLGGRYPSELSGGQQQRVAVGRLLATRPPVFLMDEPLSNLDARLRLDMRSELKRLHYDLDVTTVYVTHDQTEAMTMASRIGVMKDGQLQQLDSPHAIYHTPANLFVAEFVGMPRINTFSGEIKTENGQTVLETDDITMPIELPWRDAAKKITAAIRPEDFTLSLEPRPESSEWRVYAILPAGPEQYIQVKRGNRTVMIREIRELDLHMDQSVWISAEPSAVNLYDTENGSLLPGKAELETGGRQKAGRENDGAA
jgi:ABC-type sugar transport system ATPase subunit